MARFREEMARYDSTTSLSGGAPAAREDPRIGRRFGSIEGSEMEIEREEVRKKRSQSLSVPSPDFVGGDVSLQEWISVLASTTKVRS